MEQKEKVYLDRMKLVLVLEKIAVAVESKNKLKKYVWDIDKALTDFINSSNLDKEKLVTKWIQVAGKEGYDNLLVKTTKKYYEKLALILQSGAIYLNKTNDPLYLIAELIIATDHFLYGKINLKDS